MKYESIRDLSTNPYIIQCSNSTSLAHFHSSIELIYVINGRVAFSHDGKNYVLEEDQIAFIDSYQTHSNSPLPECTTINLVAQQEFIADFKYHSKTKKIPTVLKDAEFNRSMKPLFLELIDSTTQNDQLLIKGYLNLLLGKLLGYYGTHSATVSNKSKEIIDIITYINDNYASPLSLEGIADHFHYNKFYFSKLFNKFFNCSITTYIGIIRVQAVMEKLHSKEENSLIDAVFNCGFNSLSTFYRYRKISETYYNRV